MGGNPFDGQPATVGNGTHIGFIAPTKEAVHAFYEAALASGGPHTHRIHEIAVHCSLGMHQSWACNCSRETGQLHQITRSHLPLYRTDMPQSQYCHLATVRFPMTIAAVCKRLLESGQIE